MLKEAEMMNGITLIIILIIIPTLLESPAPNATVMRKIWPTMPMSERRIFRLENIFERQILPEVLLVQLAGPILEYERKCQRV